MHSDNFNADYWKLQAARLAVVDRQIMHTHYAAFVADQCGDRLRFIESIGWFRWNGKHWETAPDESVAYQAVTDAATVLAQFVAQNGAGSGAWAVESSQRMLIHRERVSIVQEMRALRQLRDQPDTLDAATHLLSFRNGTVDLRSGELKPHDPADMLTHAALVDYRPDAPAPRWAQFVNDVFPNDADMQTYFQTFLGYAITGEIREHILGVWYGHQGRNGKGTTIRTLQSIFGSTMVMDVPFTLFERTRQEPHSEQIAALQRARIVVAQEGNAETPMDTARIKNYTGGDRISARKLRQEVFSFLPRFTLVMATNHLPEFASGGAALWARTKAVEFAQSFAGREDRTLEPALQGSEREGIAAWLVQGAVRYYQEGLKDPAAVTEATAMHKDAVDPLKELVGEIFDYDEGGSVQRSEFNARLKVWRDNNGDKSSKFSPGSVKRHLLNNGVTEERVMAGGWHYVGVRLMNQVPSEEQRKRDAAVADGTAVRDIFGQDRPA
jgi:putative DNA primase/helicase